MSTPETPPSKIRTPAYHLTGREKHIIGLLWEEASPKEIAHRMGISDSTVSVHRFNIRRKMGVRTDIGVFKKYFGLCTVPQAQ